MMRKRLLSWLGAGCFALLGAQAHAMPMTDTFVVTIDNGTDIEFALFDVTQAGGFQIDAQRTSGDVDPHLYLFRDDGTGQLSFGQQFLRDNNDGPWNNSRINVRRLGLGSYVLAAGDYPVSVADVVYGYNFINPIPRTGDIALSVAGRDFGRGVGAASFTRPPAAVPEPAGIALLGIGLLGAVAVRRRRANA